MAGGSVLTDIRSMIDLAIGTPEVGVVDFCMLHTVLHCLAQQLNALDKPVKLQGGVNVPVVMPSSKDAQTIAITEYIVETDANQHPKPKSIKPPKPVESTLLVVERVKWDGPAPEVVSATTTDHHARKKSSPAPPAASGKASQEHVADVSVTEGGERDEGRREEGRHYAEPRQVTSAEKLSLVTLSKFNLLQNTVQDLKDRVYGSMPKNEAILEEVRSQTNIKAITDMWTNLNVSSRLEAAETGLAKLSSLVEDLIKEGQNFQKLSTGVAVAPASAPVAPASATPGAPAPASATPGAPAPASATPGAPASATPGAPAPASASPGAPAPASATPGAPAPASATPGAPAPAYATPGAPAPASATPGAPAPASATPGAPAPAPATPGVPAPASATPGALAPASATPGAPAPAYATPGAPAPAPATPGAPAPAYATPGAPAPTTAWAPVPTTPGGLVAVTPEQMEMLNSLMNVGRPYPWDLLAAELDHDRDATYNQLHRLRSDIDTLNQTFYNAMESLKNNLDLKEEIPLPPPPPSVPMEELFPPPAAHVAAAHLAAAHLAAAHLAASPGAAAAQTAAYPAASAPGGAPTAGYRAMEESRRSSGTVAAIAARLAQLEYRIKECCDGMGKDRGTVQDQLNNFQDQLDHLIHQIGTLHELKLSPNLSKDLEGLMELYQTVQDMQEQLRQVNEMARQLAGEKDDRQHHIRALLEQIEILKTIKMDREDMAEAMAEKADLRLLARKVSHDQFEMACDDLSRGLEHALGKLNTQEALWQQVLDDVQREIESKLDKMELSPLKDFFEKKLRLLQDNLKQMASLRRNVEAAGTKRRLLRDVNCISCDADAVMPLENTAATSGKPLPAHFSMKPYLSYELDAIRKTQASNLPQRNLHDWETIEKQKATKQPMRVRSETDKHICNRYCGGSHTTTTPAQRVARIGHFIKQWGPDVVPLSSGLAAGDDGKLYKVTTKEPTNVSPVGSVDPSCTKKPKTPEPHKQPPKVPAIVGHKECRCIDGDA